MFKYVKFTKVEAVDTVLEFRGGSEEVKVNHFDVDVVSLESDSESNIDALAASQDTRIGCEYITHDEFKELVRDSLQLKRIREVVASEIAKRYSIADEIAMSKRASDDEKRVAYETHVQECVAYGNTLKSEVGY
jgi:hypothetical protein